MCLHGSPQHFTALKYGKKNRGSSKKSPTFQVQPLTPTLTPNRWDILDCICYTDCLARHLTDGLGVTSKCGKCDPYGALETERSS